MMRERENAYGGVVAEYEEGEWTWSMMGGDEVNGGTSFEEAMLVVLIFT